MSSSLDEMYDFGVLRTLRKREQLTIADVRERSGISPAVISKLERNQTRAELETLFRLGRVFGMNAADLLSLAERQTAQVKPAEEHDGGTGFLFQRVTYDNHHAYFGRASKGAKTHRPEIHKDDFRVAVGAGLRVAIPAMGPAPIALDLAVPIAREQTDQIQNFSFFVGFGR